ncbi:MAG TPA: LysM peptidoglycan-binding domain-containing protein [Rubricoccaceae bacterium]|nr:LysM peptidoglycan-binding domain-containing protein [Rubricoccaceae bacterium]
MPRLPLVALASLFLVTPALAQSPALDAALRSRPVEPIRSHEGFPLDAAAVDSLTAEQLARRIAHLYARQAELLEADAAGDTDRYAALLDALVIDVQLLAERPGVSSDLRFREAYSSILTEYERFYDEPALDRGEIYPFLEEAFAAANSVDGPLLEDVRLPSYAGGAYTTVFPMEVNRLVENSVRFLQRSTGHVSRLRSRADTYFPMIERILAEEGVPDELKYLAMVESALNPRARSHAAAVGMWQFIAATGRAYNLRAQSEVDDRLDPEASTRAAARHLRDLYERFGDWQLALAGYNCNPARIQREVERAEARLGRKATFWDIYDHIPRETRNYVPMFIATALVLSNPEAYGFPASYEPGPRYTFDVIPVEGGTSLGTVATLIGVHPDVLSALNPSLRRDRVPVQREPWMLRIPAGAYAQHAEALDRLAPRSARTSERYAARTVNYGTRAHRPISPLDEQVLVAAAPARPAPRRSSSPSTSLLAQQPDVPVRTVADEAAEEARGAAPSARESESRPRTTTHRVRRGENLTEIARRYGVTVNQIINANDLRSTTIRPGQRLRIDASASRARSGATTSGPRTTTHRVRSGENLTTIARRYGVTVRQIMDWNNLRSTTIRPGQRLRIQTRGRVG